MHPAPSVVLSPAPVQPGVSVTAAVVSVCLCPDSTERPLLHFGHGDLHNTTALLLSSDSSTLYVGAQNAILSLDVNQSDVIRLNKKVLRRNCLNFTEILLLLLLRSRDAQQFVCVLFRCSGVRLIKRHRIARGKERI